MRTGRDSKRVKAAMAREVAGHLKKLARLFAEVDGLDAEEFGGLAQLFFDA